MGVVCSGETIPAAGNELELAASVVAIDAGTDDRAIDVIAGYGFGALDVVDADIAGVPDGELTTGCVSADALAACLTFWSLDGLIVGTTLWSDQQALPDGTSEAVLAALSRTRGPRRARHGEPSHRRRRRTDIGTAPRRRLWAGACCRPRTPATAASTSGAVDPLTVGALRSRRPHLAGGEWLALPGG